jgi:hypothetical protein
VLARDLNPPRQVTFVLVVDACRVAEMDQATLSSSLEPQAASAPKKWALCFSCSRDSTASDGPQGAHSPFAQELLDEKAGIFAAGVPLKGGLEEACRRMREQHQGQDPMPVGLHSIKEDWCFYPGPAERVSSGLGNVPSPTAGKSLPRQRQLQVQAQGKAGENSAFTGYTLSLFLSLSLSTSLPTSLRPSVLLTPSRPHILSLSLSLSLAVSLNPPLPPLLPFPPFPPFPPSPPFSTSPPSLTVFPSRSLSPAYCRPHWVQDEISNCCVRGSTLSTSAKEGCWAGKAKTGNAQDGPGIPRAPILVARDL